MNKITLDFILKRCYIYYMIKICQYCKKEFQAKRKKQNYCSIQCVQLNRKIINNCNNCGKEFYRKGRSINPYCSKQCAGEARKKGKIITCIQCGKEKYKPLSHIKSDLSFCSHKCANSYQGRNKVKYICKICGNDFYISLSKSKNRRYCSQKCLDKDITFLKEKSVRANLIQMKNNELNKLELAGQSILKEIGCEYKEQVLVADKFLVDVFILANNLIIQWDGDYWHCHSRFKKPDKRQLKRKVIDKSQNAYFKKCGYNLLRFWESDVKNKRDWVKTEIQNAINGQLEFVKRTV